MDKEKNIGDSCREKAKNQADIDVPYVARLARLELSEEETCLFQQQIKQILDYVRELEGVDVEGVMPMAHTMDICNVMRLDEERPGLDRPVVLANAPRHDDEQFIVPKIM